MTYRTKQREAVLEVLRVAGRPLTAQAVIDLAAERCPGIGAATVFRALKQAVETGAVLRLELPGLAPHYELSSDKHHHFFVCESCQQLLPLNGCVNLAQLLPSGTRMRRHEIVIFGECPNCAAH